MNQNKNELPGKGPKPRSNEDYIRIRLAKKHSKRSFDSSEHQMNPQSLGSGQGRAMGMGPCPLLPAPLDIAAMMSLPPVPKLALPQQFQTFGQPLPVASTVDAPLDMETSPTYDQQPEPMDWM
ncbi:uncharacterized protein LOC117891561 [Drosophila subobscura]|uniref:uncharacterized protein LOC117891561 n=1 Tax=Drosophila subobscura TaxID=7241 RepID=UPI00155B085A|nr:uncharacterized protein LOC117891561 [Drosophila subobscura]